MLATWVKTIYSRRRITTWLNYFQVLIQVHAFLPSVATDRRLETVSMPKYSRHYKIWDHFLEFSWYVKGFKPRFKKMANRLLILVHNRWKHLTYIFNETENKGRPNWRDLYLSLLMGTFHTRKETCLTSMENFRCDIFIICRTLSLLNVFLTWVITIQFFLFNRFFSS